jgi:hypothetical protein
VLGEPVDDQNDRGRLAIGKPPLTKYFFALTTGKEIFVMLHFPSPFSNSQFELRLTTRARNAQIEGVLFLRSGAFNGSIPLLSCAYSLRNSTPSIAQS